ncbi:MAG: SurA N-terminal domain-containing protein [Planctomycetota bacterium]
MAISVTISKGYVWRLIIIGVVCLVLGAWGVYDFAVDIPQRQRLHEQADLLERCRDALETEQAAGQITPEAQEALDAITADMESLINRELTKMLGPDQANATPQQMMEVWQQFAPESEASDDGKWMVLLNVIGQGLVAERRLPLNEQEFPLAFAAFEAADNVLVEIGQVTAPGKYDRITQWAFILCLPCAPWFFWGWYTVRRRKYILDEDGTLHTPAGAWPEGEIADIDMGRWMAKSIAWVVHSDGRRVKLDDYKFKGLHRIVGAIASRLHPADWDSDAKVAGQTQDAPDAGTDGESLSEPAARADAP